MTDDANGASVAASSSSRSQSVHGARWLRRLAAGLLALVVVLVPTVWVAPAYIAQILVASQLDERGIAHEGLASLDVDLFNGTVSLGPIDVRGADSAPARLAHVDVHLDTRGLLAGRASIQRLVAHGAELEVVHAEEGVVTLNGIPLDEVFGAILGPVTDAWEIGIESLELRDSRLVFQSRWGGRLALEVDRLMMNGFRSWQPDKPGKFEFEARVNDIGLKWAGDATPFSEPVTIVVDSEVNDVDLEKVRRFTGSLGFQRRGGIYSFRGKHELSLPAAGPIRLASKGTLSVSGADYFREGEFEFNGDRMEAEYDTRIGFENRHVELAGRLGFVLENAVLSVPDQVRVALESTELSLEDIDSSRAEDGSFRVKLTPSFEAKGGELSGRIKLSVDVLVNLLRILHYLAAGQAQPDHRTGLEDWGTKEVTLPQSDLSIARIQTKSKSVEIIGEAGTVALQFDGVTVADDMWISSETQTTSIREAELSVEHFRFQSGQESLLLEALASARAIGTSIIRENREVAIEELDATVAQSELNVSAGIIAGKLVGEGGIRGMKVAVPEHEDAPPITLDLESARAMVDDVSLKASPQQADWRIGGAAEAGNMAFDVGRSRMATGTVSGIHITGVVVDKRLQIVADAVEVTGADLAATRSFLAGVHLGDDEKNAGEEGGQTEKGEPSSDSSRLSASTETSMTVVTTSLVREVQGLLAELGFDPGPKDGIAGRKTAAAVEAFQNQVGLAVDGGVSSELRRVLLASKRGEAIQPVTAQTASSPSQARTKKSPTVRLARLEFANGTKIQFSDDTVDPDVDVHMAFETLSVRNIDTANASQRTGLTARAEVNEFSPVEVDGWVTPFRDPPDMDIEIRIQRLELSPYSPYIEEWLGFHAEKGQLDSSASATVTDGTVDGRVELEVEHLEVGQLSEQDAKRFATTVGVPADTAVGLLKDAEGRIRLTIPVSGTVDEPKFDLSDAINQAVGGALKAMFPPNWIASMLKGGGDDIDFEPIVFKPGSSVLEDDGRQFLDKLADLMGEHPEVPISVCGRTVFADVGALTDGATPTAPVSPQPEKTDVQPRPAVGASLSPEVVSDAGALAVLRTRSVRQYLVKDRGVNKERVTECRARFDANDSGPPRVEISL